METSAKTCIFLSRATMKLLIELGDVPATKAWELVGGSHFAQWISRGSQVGFTDTTSVGTTIH